jgi:decaprenyl-phosphate phosphoribosyltransferase
VARVSATDVRSERGLGVGLLVSCRARQWVKNLLVLAAPMAAGQLTDPDVARATLLAVLAFLLASSAVYLFNDAADVEADRLHPVKRHRPVAAGQVPVRLARAAAAGLAVASLAVASLTGLPLVALMVTYLALQAAYALSLKHQPVLDIAVVASGFLLRAVAGGLAAELPISQWFLLVAGFGSLYIVAGKRYSELRTLGADAGTRRALSMYTESYLRFIWGVATAVTIMSYSLWAFREPGTGVVQWHALSIAPFVLGMMRYAVDIDAGRAGEPEDIVWRDHVLQAVGAVWLATLLLGVARG